MGRKGGMSRSQSREMFKRITASKEENAELERQAAARRLTDPLEQAKTFLRRRGWHCFDHRVHVPGSTLVVVGRTPMLPEDVIEKVRRLKEAEERDR